MLGRMVGLTGTIGRLSLEDWDLDDMQHDAWMTGR
jgi:hypothetical protein